MFPRDCQTLFLPLSSFSFEGRGPLSGSGSDLGTGGTGVAPSAKQGATLAGVPGINLGN